MYDFNIMLNRAQARQNNGGGLAIARKHYSVKIFASFLSTEKG